MTTPSHVQPHPDLELDEDGVAIIGTRHMLSTVDNPFNPHTQEEAWSAYDRQAGHCCWAYIGRVANFSNVLSEVDEYQTLEAAIDEILRENVNGLFIKVPEPTKES